MIVAPSREPKTELHIRHRSARAPRNTTKEISDCARHEDLHEYVQMSISIRWSNALLSA
jgi:hypothetical protein